MIQRWKQRLRLQNQPLSVWVNLAICSALLIALVQVQWLPPSLAQEAPATSTQEAPATSTQEAPATPKPNLSESQHETLPPLQIHPLPRLLTQWQDSESQGDYFSVVKPTPAGYLVWSQLPIKVYVEPPTATSEVSSETTSETGTNRSQQWFTAVTQAIQEWNIYLPLKWVDSSEVADIAVWRRTPTIQAANSAAIPAQNTGQPDTGQPGSQISSPPGTFRDRLPRARSAETRYHLYIDRPSNAPATLSQRFTIQLSPNQTADYTKATARHEFGHALGIWGHSPSPTDVMYFAQVRHPPAISHRDVNTLKRIYEQPTRIGWAVGDT